MTPMFFGTSGRALFGVYHPPTGERERELGVVLCYPFGHEYMRAHRAFRQLAMLLARDGYPVLRFDYSGTGDSAGDAEDATIARWREDVSTAIEELEDTAGVERVALVGLRLGAAVSVLAAASRGDVERLVLWDPVVDGGDYLRELLEARCEWDTGGAGSSVSVGPGRPPTVHGFVLGDAMAADLQRLSLLETQRPACNGLRIVVARPRSDYDALAAHLSTPQMPLRVECEPAPDNWGEVDHFGSVLVPQQLIRCIVNSF
ncbi:MAG: serine aminopeptidase domain-containing protein [Burkholderiales bacterium]|jgi:pimeloyl-ACP methyl ester carboxylesterase|nr:alpha/beta hydrolase [Burkholderiales bacterium]MCZ8102376.1 alpha/beta hydrolase [Burkholderiales bacterium]